MTPEEYLSNILVRTQANTGPDSPARAVRGTLLPLLQQWGGNHIGSVDPSGSFAKGTANHPGNDIDLFISLKPSASAPLKDIYNSLGERLTAAKFTPRRQNVSWNVSVDGFSVDLVPARQQDDGSSDHSLYLQRDGKWTKTNVEKHIKVVRAGHRLGESRLIKLWRDQKNLDFPSFYIELCVIRALGIPPNPGAGGGSWAANLQTVFRFLRDELESARIEDPANSGNVISDDLNASEKRTIRDAAAKALDAKNWGEIIL